MQFQLWGIPLALLGAVFLAFGAQYQSRGLRKVENITGKSASHGLNFSQIIGLLKRPSWVVGTLLLGLATVLQLVSLSLSPLVVVQPIGVIALVITAILNTRYSGVKLGFRARIAIAASVAGITFFVLLAARNTNNTAVSRFGNVTLLTLFTILIIFFVTFFLIFKNSKKPLLLVISAGVIYAFVATFAKTVITSFQQGTADTLTWVSILALVSGTAFGLLFVQNAYSSGSPDLVVAGLTVIDPLVAVLIGIIILGELITASPGVVVGFIGSGALAVWGVTSLARHHPQTGMSSLAATSTGAIAVIVQEEPE